MGWGRGFAKFSGVEELERKENLIHPPTVSTL
jgi:hypothetical protein